ncbi:unnamed protein product, partial [Owenia fusiformis]
MKQVTLNPFYGSSLVVILSLVIIGLCSTDANECDTENGGCEQICSINNGTNECSCNDGFTLRDDEYNCTVQRLYLEGDDTFAHPNTFNIFGVYELQQETFSDRVVYKKINVANYLYYWPSDNQWYISETLGSATIRAYFNENPDYPESIQTPLYVIGSDDEWTASYYTLTSCTEGIMCACDDGYEYNGSNCTNIDECSIGTDSCKTAPACSDTDGAYTCSYDNECGCEHTCSNNSESYECSCNNGFTLQDDNHTCAVQWLYLEGDDTYAHPNSFNIFGVYVLQQDTYADSPVYKRMDVAIYLYYGPLSNSWYIGQTLGGSIVAYFNEDPNYPESIQTPLYVVHIYWWTASHYTLTPCTEGSVCFCY